MNRFCSVCENKWNFTILNNTLFVQCKVCGNQQEIDDNENLIYSATKNTLNDLYGDVIR